MYLLAEIRKCITYEIEIEGEGHSSTMYAEVMWFRVNKNAHNPMGQHLLLYFVRWMYYSLQLSTCFATNRSKIRLKEKSEANLKRWKENSVLTDDKGCGYLNSILLNNERWIGLIKSAGRLTTHWCWFDSSIDHVMVYFSKNNVKNVIHHRKHALQP